MKEIGGYIEFERNTGDIYHNDALGLNCGRNCLLYLIRSKKIAKIKLPKFLCDSVRNVCIRENVEIDYYDIDIDFMPIDVKLEDDEWIYLVNYYGQFNADDILAMKKQFSRVVIDNAQNYFQKPVAHVDTLYTCRKFFGVADGAFLYTDKHIDVPEQDFSYDRMHFLMGRFERPASEFYSAYVANNELFENESIKKMSLLTENILRGLNYEKIENIRTRNFLYLQDRFCKWNKLNLKVPIGAFMYPLYVANGAEIRTKLLAEKIYIPTLWPDVYEICREDDLEYDLAKNILPLPVDQRYDERTMEYMANRIMEIIDNE